MRIVYIADDGTQFDDEWECESYEKCITHQAMYGIQFFNNKDRDFYHITKGNEFSDDIYQRADVVVVHSDEELKCLQWLTDYCGWLEFKMILSTGTWLREPDEFFNGLNVWKKVM